MNFTKVLLFSRKYLTVKPKKQASPAAYTLSILILVFFSTVILFSAVSSSSAGIFSNPERRKKRRENLENFLEMNRGRVVSQEAKHEGKFHVGYKVLNTLAPNAQGEIEKIDIAVWYPSIDQPEPFQYIYGDNKVAAKVARNGRSVPDRFPLIIYSHGATGCGLSMTFLTERLASEGFIVVAPDYTDKYYGARISKPLPKQTMVQKMAMLKWMNELKEYQLNKGGKKYRPNLAYRIEQTKAAIDQLLKENQNNKTIFHNLIDENKIGMVGHSFGGWTSILIGGADSNYKDSRVKAIAPLSSPCNEDVYDPNELKNIHIPVLFMFGGEEPKVGRMSDRELLYDRANAPKFLLEIEGATHFTFSGGIRKEFPTISEYTLKDPKRAAIVEYTVAFFKYYLKKDEGAKKQLNIKSDAVISYIKDFGN